MRHVYVDGGIVKDVARVNPYSIFAEAYASQFIEAPDEVEGGWLYDGENFIAPTASAPEIPQEVTMAQCRLALFDKHDIQTDEQFYALTDILPVEMRPRALLELRTRPTVRYDNPLVDAFCAVKGWDKDELFIYADTL